jgi:prephenate dehydrogenase
VLLTNTKNASRGIDKVIAELTKLKEAIKGENKVKIEKLLETARDKRATLIKYKIKKKEMIS